MATLSTEASAGCSARGLPNAFYTDPAVFAEEQRRLFGPNWAAVGFGKDVPEPGDLRPVEFLGRPLLLVRDRERRLRVFENVCRHRGMKLVSEPQCRRSTIRCPYHSWAYGLDGRLRATPLVGGPGRNSHPALDPAELGLLEVRSAVWLDLVFVNLDGSAPAFADWAAPLLDRWRDFAEQPLVPGGPEGSLSLELQANWKLVVENYCDGYHLPWVHPGLNGYSRLEDHYPLVAEGFAGQGSSRYAPGGTTFPSFAGLGAQWHEGAEYAALFPNALLGVHRDHIFTLVVEPLAHDRTRERLEIYYADAAAAGPEQAEERTRQAALWRTVFEEDVFVVEGMQRGRAAPGFDGGRFSPAMDEAVQAFHAWAARGFEAAR